MPPKRRNNNKKKGVAGKGRGRGNPQSRTSSANNTGTRASRDIGSTLKGTRPSGWKEVLAASSNKSSNSYPSLYVKYKQATSKFFNYMMDQCPASVRGETKSVNSLIKAAEWMQETEHVLTGRSIMRNLEVAIRNRHRVSQSVFGGGDAGHQHVFSVLVYCWSILKDLPVAARTPRVTDPTGIRQEEMNTFEWRSPQAETNRYEALMEDEDEDEDDSFEDMDENNGRDENIFPSMGVSRPEMKEEPLTLQDLMTSDDRNDAILFLLTLDELMESISVQYQCIVRNFHDYNNVGAPDSAIMEKMLEAAVATNMAIQQVQQYEMDLQTQHPHFTTPYRLLATLVLPDITRSITSIMREHAAKTCKERDVSSYLGDCIECYIRNPTDPHNKQDTIVQDFCRQWEVNSTGTKELEEIFKGLKMVTRLEVPVASEEHDNRRFYSLLQAAGSNSQPRAWIQNMPRIGGDRAIHHTLRLLQSFGQVIESTPNNKGIAAARPGFFGSPWHPGRARKLRDLDELLMTKILPQWVAMCRHGILQRDLPRQDELCPLFVLIREYVREPEKSVSWSVSFAIHSLLTAILETDTIADKLLSVNRNVFDNYFANVTWSHDIAKQEPDNVDGSTWQKNMVMTLFMENLGLPVFGEWTLWNPLCGGTIFSYLTYFSNLEGGCALVDCHAQLRIVLHLFHALLVRGILHRGEIPLLDLIYDGFQKSKGVWEGGLPRKGEFVQRFWICFGASSTFAKEMSEQAQTGIRLGRSKPTRKQEQRAMNRKMTPIEPSHISKSYRRICKRDFHGVVDKYHTPEQRSRTKGTEQYLHAVRTNDTLDALEEEQRLLSLNLPVAGVLLEQFVCSLGRILQWDDILKGGMQDIRKSQDMVNFKRQGFVHLFAQYLLGALDFADDPFSYNFLDVPLCEASSHFMKVMFQRIDPSKMLWFQAILEADSSIS